MPQHPSTTATIIETTCNHLYRVTDAGPRLEHLYLGIEVKRVRGGFADKAKAKPELVRRAACRVVAEG